MVHEDVGILVAFKVIHFALESRGHVLLLSGMLEQATKRTVRLVAWADADLAGQLQASMNMRGLVL